MAKALSQNRVMETGISYENKQELDLARILAVDFSGTPGARARKYHAQLLLLPPSPSLVFLPMSDLSSYFSRKKGQENSL